MSVASPSNPGFDPQLARMPDPVPAILKRRRLFFGKLAIITAIWILLCHGLYTFLYPFPEGWFFGVYLLIWAGLIAGNAYAHAHRQAPPILSFVDYGIHIAFRSLVYLAGANVLWSVWHYVKHPDWPAVLAAFWKRLFMLPDTLGSAGFNFFQVALLAVLGRGILETLRAVQSAKPFRQELAPAEERSIEKAYTRARRLMAKKRPEEAKALLDEAQEKLGRLQAETTHKGLRYHRLLMQDKIEVLRQGAPLSRPSRAAAAFEDSGSGPQPAEEQSAPSSQQPGTKHEGLGQYREYVEALREKAEVDWKDVAGLDEVVDDLKTAFGMALAQAPSGVQLDPPKRVLLYGPPGTGKTLLTAAVSHHFDADFFNVKVSDVLSKFFGESTRLLGALFYTARENAPAILFFDEFESISGSRDGPSMDGEERRMISSILAELDGLKGKGDSAPVFTIAATNMPWQLDPAILSRFDKQFYVPLPDETARRRIFQVLLEEKGFKSDVSLEQMVRHTRGYSGRELRQLCQEAIRLMLSEANPNMGKEVDKGRDALNKFKMRVQPLSASHLNRAYRKVRPQTSPEMLQRYLAWQNRA